MSIYKQGKLQDRTLLFEGREKSATKPEKAMRNLLCITKWNSNFAAMFELYCNGFRHVIFL